MTGYPFQRRPIRVARPAAVVHLFTIGQAVRLKAELPHKAEIYHVTGTLPEKDNSLQYRIRNSIERHERVITEDQLEAVATKATTKGQDLIDRTFSRA